MPEHKIRLRGGWEWWPVTGGETGARPQRLTLPADWPRTGPPSGRLVRSFHTPPHDPTAETVWLELVEVPGLRSLTLNGQRLRPGGTAGPEARVELPGRLPPRSRLELEVGPTKRATVGELPDGWGHVALVIAPRSGLSPPAGTTFG